MSYHFSVGILNNFPEEGKKTICQVSDDRQDPKPTIEQVIEIAKNNNSMIYSDQENLTRDLVSFINRATKHGDTLERVLEYQAPPKLLKRSSRGKKQINKQKIVELLEYVLIRLSETGDIRTIDDIMDDGFVISQEGIQDCLEKAARGDNIKIIEFWLQNGAKASNVYNYYPLHAAAANNAVKAIKLLVEKGMDLNSRDNAEWGPEENSTPLHAAVDRHSYQAVKTLLKCSANPDLYNSSSQSPLQIAAQLGDAEMCSILLENGVDVNARSDEGTLTALMWAVRSQDEETIEILLNFGADPALQCIYEDTLEKENAFDEAKRINNEEILLILTET